LPSEARRSNAFGPWSAVAVVEKLAVVLGRLAEMGDDLGAVRGVAHDVRALGRRPVDDEIVEDGSFRVAAAGVERLPVHEPFDVVRHEVIDHRERVLAVEAQPTHVRDVEEARGCADGGVLIDDARVLYRHRVASERDHAAAELHVLLVDWGAAERLVHGAAA
jgi:hypothetical protein